MADIVRGRFNLASREQADAVAAELVRRFPGSRVEAPRDDYPRWHVYVVDAGTGLRHEWQVGTRATTRFLETNSVHPAGMKAVEGHNSFHDVWFAHLLKIRDPNVKARFGLEDFGKRYTQLLMETEAGPPANFQMRYQQLSDELACILTRMNEEKPGYYESLSHQ